MRSINLKGCRFGRLVVVRRARNRGIRTRWMCRCVCGRRKIAFTLRLRDGRTRSCGCFREETRASVSKYAGVLFKTGSVKKFPEYGIWLNMRRRCYNVNDAYYPTYGGRGIKVCAAWRNNFVAFFKYIGRRPSSKHSLDRFPDQNGDYRPGNVRWATMIQQNRNRRSNRVFRIEGVTKTLTEWLEIAVVSRNTALTRLQKGWRPKRAFFVPGGQK